jgi:hypothetical protein
MSVTSDGTGRSIGPHHEAEDSYWRLRMTHCLDLIKDWGNSPEWVSETMLRYKLSDRGPSPHRTLDLASISSRFTADDGDPSTSTTGDLTAATGWSATCFASMKRRVFCGSRQVVISQT